MVKEEYKKNEKNVSAQEWLDSEYPQEKKILERKKENIIKLDISQENLEDALRLEDFAGLNELNCSYNKLTKLEIVNCPKLEILYCRNNQLIELKIQDCPKLKRVYCESNKLVELNLSGQKELIELQCYNNQLMKLELADCSNLNQLDCYNNQLNFLDLTNCSSLENVNCYKNQLTKLEFNNSPNLKNLKCYENKLSMLELKNSFRLEKLDCDDNQLTKLDLTENKKLTELDLKNNQLTSLDLTKCSQLVKVNCCNNNLRELLFPFQGKSLNNLNLKNNNFPEQDLTLFRNLVSLVRLTISNDDKTKIDQGIYNRFFGSLEPLREMKNLYELDLSNTDVSSGLTYLSESVKLFCGLSNLRDDAQVKAISSLLAEEKGDFSRKLKAIKQKKLSPQIDQTIFLVEQLRMADKISAFDLWKELKLAYNLSNSLISWQDYLKLAPSSDDLEIRKNHILKVLKKLKEAAEAKERQFQEELAKQKEELEKKIKELEANQLTNNERKILQKLEELFNAFGQVSGEKNENNQELTKMVADYQKLDFTTDAPNLSKVFKSGSENLFSQIDSFVEKINISKEANESQEKLQTEVVKLQTELEKVKESRQELVAELAKRDSEIADSLTKKENLRLKIDGLQERIQKNEEELKQFPHKIKNAKEEIKKRVRETTESTSSLWKNKDILEKKEKRLQNSVEKAKSRKSDLEKEEKRLEKLLKKTQDDTKKTEINAKIKNTQEQMEKLEQELNSQLENQNLVAQVEVKNNKNNPYV